jgi:hypothetical protein
MNSHVSNIAVQHLQREAIWLIYMQCVDIAYFVCSSQMPPG